MCVGKLRAQDGAMINHELTMDAPRYSPPSHLLLHVDDDEDVAFLLKRALQASQMAHWSLLYLPSGREALNYLQRSRIGELPAPTLLALDIKMPGMGGLEVLDWVNTNMPAVPAVMLSSSGLIEDRLRARDLGSVGYFEKSPTFCDLIEYLRDWETSQFCDYAEAACA